MSSVLSTRTMSGFPVSIGTGLALESLLEPVIEVYDESREVPTKVQIGNYTLIAVNVSTLLRNIMGSVNTDSSVIIKHADYLQVLKEEIEYLNDLFVFQDLEPVFYINTYDYVKKHYPVEKLRKATTFKQLQAEMIVNYCLSSLMTEQSIRKYSNKIHIDKKYKVLMMTHVPWDLLSHSEFLKLDLLESHTGVLKTKKDWYSKYYKLPNRDMSILPFTQELLALFGDHILFHPDAMKKRIEVYEHLNSKKINPTSSDDLIKMLLNALV